MTRATEIMSRGKVPSKMSDRMLRWEFKKWDSQIKSGQPFNRGDLEWYGLLVGEISERKMRK